MDGRNGKDSKSRNIPESDYITPDDGFVPQFDKVTHSQCVSCKNNLGGTKCRFYGVKPRRYQFVSSGLRCPQVKK